MPVIQREVSLLTATSTDNVFSGSAFEYSMGRQALSCGSVGSATGLLITLQAGPDIIVEECNPMVLTTMPIVPDHMYYNDIMEPMQRLRLSVRNPTGGTLVSRSLAIITPL